MEAGPVRAEWIDGLAGGLRLLLGRALVRWCRRGESAWFVTVSQALRLRSERLIRQPRGPQCIRHDLSAAGVDLALEVSGWPADNRWGHPTTSPSNPET